MYFCTILTINNKLESGPMPNVMAALPNIGGALCSTPQSLVDAHYYTVCHKKGANLFFSVILSKINGF